MPARTVMSLMGWSSAEMAARYQHVTDTIRQEVARQVDDLIWRARKVGGPGVGAHSNGEAMVPVSKASLATVLGLAELGLTQADNASLATGRAAIEQVRAYLIGNSAEPGSGEAATTEAESN